MSKYLLLFIYTVSFLLFLCAPLAQSASSDEEKYDERMDIGQKSQQYSDPTKKTNPPEIMKSSPAVNPNNQNKGSPSNPSDEKNDNPMGGTGNR